MGETRSARWLKKKKKFFSTKILHEFSTNSPRILHEFSTNSPRILHEFSTNFLHEKILHDICWREPPREKLKKKFRRKFRPNSDGDRGS